jgi:hypothetical protein
MRRTGPAILLAVVALTAVGVPVSGSASAVCGSWQLSGRGLDGGANDIEVVGSNDVWLVGWRGYDHYGSMSYHWDGRAWREVVVPEPRGPHGRSWVLEEASAISSREVWAVGYRRPFPRETPAHPIAARWNGSKWRWVPVGLDGIHGVLLGSAADPRTGRVWAVGYLEGGAGRRNHTLVVRWNGERWRRVASPGSRGTESWFSDVVVVGRTAWAVGGMGNRVLLSRWNGRAWTEVEGPRGSLAAIDGAGPGRMAAVGGSLVMVHNGGGWRIAVRLDRPAGLDDVVVPSFRDAWASGGIWDAKSQRFRPTLIRRYGSSWRRVPSPVTSTVLEAIDGTTRDLRLAAGRSTGDFDYTTRVFHRC